MRRLHTIGAHCTFAIQLCKAYTIIIFIYFIYIFIYLFICTINFCLPYNKMAFKCRPTT